MFDLDRDGYISKQDWELSFAEYPMSLGHMENTSPNQ